jgi:hypothetical protein
MSVTLTWHPLVYERFTGYKGDSPGTVSRKLKQVFGGDFPLDLNVQEHGKIIGAMVAMQEHDNTIYHQIYDALAKHSDITIKAEY